MTAVTSIEPPPRSASDRLRRALSFDNRYLPPFLVTCILLVGHVGFGFLESFSRTLTSIGCSVGTELVLSRLILGRWPHLASAYITGISAGILIRSPAYWPFVLCSMISVTSKYALRWEGRHIWNPSNLGVSAMLFLAPSTVASISVQWGNSLLPMIVVWMLGTVIIWRLKRFHVCATYVASFLALSFVRTAATGDPWLAQVAPITGPMYQLYIFFMITDPKTTVRTRWGRCVTVFLVAVVEMLLRLNRVVHAPYYALFLVGPVAFVIEIWWNRRLAAKASTPAPELEPSAPAQPAPATA